MERLCPSCKKSISQDQSREKCPHCAAPLAHGFHAPRNSHAGPETQRRGSQSTQPSTEVELDQDHWMEYVPKEVLEHTPLEGAAYYRRLDQTPSTGDKSFEEKSNHELDFSDREREEAHRKLLRSKGLMLEVDSTGFRLGTMSTSNSPAVSVLSPYEIVRLASEFEGGVVPVEERINCPKCEAVVGPHDKTCQWCSEPINP